MHTLVAYFGPLCVSRNNVDGFLTHIYRRNPNPSLHNFSSFLYDVQVMHILCFTLSK